MLNAPTGKVVRSVAVDIPVRIADVGGWTDTWFAPRGAVCHLGVGPGITVRAELVDAAPTDRPVRLIAPDVGADYWCGPSTSSGWAEPVPLRDPLVEHAIAVVCGAHPPPCQVTLRVSAAVPPGASLGTSAAVLVGVMTALDAVLADSSSPPLLGSGVARLAHRVETVAAGRQAGVQDHWAAAFGGAQLLTMTDYPDLERTPIELSPATIAALNTQVVTVAFGAHDSSAVHAQVIAALDASGPEATPALQALDALADLAPLAGKALADGDITAWAGVLTEATDLQSRLHPGLVGPAHTTAIGVARRSGALGWKVNGAGGNGGSLTVIFANTDAAQSFSHTLRATHAEWTICDLHITPPRCELREVSGA